MSTAEMRERVFELGRRESALVEEAVANVHGRSTDPDVRDTGLAWGLAAIPDVQEATVNADPLVAFADLWALAIQTESFARDGPGRKQLGEAYVFVERAAREMSRECERLAALIFGGNDVARRRSQVQNWAAQNPITADTFARPTASVALVQALTGRPQSAMGMLASTEDRLAQLDARLEMLNKTLHKRVRWTSQLLIQDSLGTENIASLVEQLQAFVEQERRNVVGDVARERDQIFTLLDSQREGVFDDVARERAAIFKHVAGERTALTAEVNHLLQQANADARGLIDRVLIRIGVGAALLIILAAAALWIVWHFSRGPRTPRGHAPRRAHHLRPASAPMG